MSLFKPHRRSHPSTTPADNPAHTGATEIGHNVRQHINRTRKNFDQTGATARDITEELRMLWGAIAELQRQIDDREAWQ